MNQAKLLMVALTFPAVCMQSPLTAQQHTGMVTSRAIQVSEPPQLSKRLGEKDQAAIGVVRSYFKALSGDTSQAFCAAGVMRIGASPAEHHFQISLGVQSNQQRLDFDVPQGKISVRFRGSTGGVIQPDGTVQKFSLSEARAGLFVTADKLSAALTDPNAALEDDGLVQEGGQSYRKITYAVPSVDATTRSSLSPPLIIALYFDPTSDLLMRTEDTVILTQNSRTPHVRVTTFSNYQPTPLGSRPFSISETRDGQVRLSLTVQSVDRLCQHNASYFSLSEGQ